MITRKNRLLIWTFIISMGALFIVTLIVEAGLLSAV